MNNARRDRDVRKYKEAQKQLVEEEPTGHETLWRVACGVGRMERTLDTWQSRPSVHGGLRQ